MSEYDISELSFILLEKSPQMRRILRDILKTFNVSDIREARDVEQAWDMFRENPPDVVLSDWAPGLDGLDFVERVRRGDDTPDPYVPVIVISGNTELRQVVEARDAGMTEFLAKPVSAKLLYLRIKAVIERYRVFIRTADFFGPDRRRRRVDFPGSERRDHSNSASDRRIEQLPFPGAERRHGYPGFISADTRATR